MSTRIISRAESGIVPEPIGRSLLQTPVRYVLCHHTGPSGWPIAGWSDAQHFAALRAYGVNVGKPYEYNFVITYPLGWIWELAGQYSAAHCLNANDWSIGIQINQADSHGDPGPAQVESFRWLVWHLVQIGWADPIVLNQNDPDRMNLGPHYRLRSTGCSANDLAESPGSTWNSPSGQGSRGLLKPALYVPWQEDDSMSAADVADLKKWLTGQIPTITKAAWTQQLDAQYGLPALPAQERLSAVRAESAANTRRLAELANGNVPWATSVSESLDAFQKRLDAQQAQLDEITRLLTPQP